MHTLARTVTVVSAVALAAALAGCGHETAELARAEPEPISSRVAGVERISTAKPVEVYGIVQPARQASVSSRVTGPIVAVHVDAGSVVAEGDILVEIQPQTSEGKVSQAEGALAQARAALALAERNLKRYEALHVDRAVSDLELDMVRMQHDQARGAVAQAEGAVQAAAAVAGDASVLAPFAARVVERPVEVGDLAAPGRPLVVLESKHGHRIWLTVRAADISRVAEGQELEVEIDARPDLGVLTGRVEEIVPSADPATQTFTVKVSLPDVRVQSGLSGEARLPGDATERLVVPVSAVHRRGGLELVVVRGEDGRARTRAVTTGGGLSGDRVEILSGLDGSESVVLDAPAPVADGTPVEVRS